jgi:hypothetical protein
VNARSPHWRWGVTIASDITVGASPALVQSLAGLKVRCPRCGQQSGRLLRARSYWPRPRLEYFLHCRRCHQHPSVRTPLHAVRLVAEVAPAEVGHLFVAD